jgi:hypothetical protein
LLLAGSRVGPYEVIAPLGAGGMGEVYRARDPRLGRDVALRSCPTTRSPTSSSSFSRAQPCDVASRPALYPRAKSSSTACRSVGVCRRPTRGGHPPRLQAREPLPDDGGRGQDPGLRAREGDRADRRRRHPSRPWACGPTRARTCSPWARSSTRCSPAGVPSRGRRPWTRSRRSSGAIHPRSRLRECPRAWSVSLGAAWRSILASDSSRRTISVSPSRRSPPRVCRSSARRDACTPSELVLLENFQ